MGQRFSNRVWIVEVPALLGEHIYHFMCASNPIRDTFGTTPAFVPNNFLAENPTVILKRHCQPRWYHQQITHRPQIRRVLP